MASLLKAVPSPSLLKLGPLFRFAAGAAATLEPWLLLATRVWLAQAFLVLQVTMVMSGRQLSATFAGSWWSDVAQHIASSGPGAAIEAVCPLLVIIGLATRPAVLALLLQVLLLHHAAEREALHAFWIVLLTALAIRGPGLFSVDRIVGPGLATSALPGARFVARAYEWLTVNATPVFLVALRLLVAAIVLLPHPDAVPFATRLPMMSAGAMHGAMAMLPPAPGALESLPGFLALAIAIAFVAGFGVRPIALILLILAPLKGATIADDAFYWVLLLGFLVVEGGGAIAIDAKLGDLLRSLIEVPPEDAHHVVIVGGGFGGHAVARGLERSSCRVTLIDRRNYHLFQPLLYQVATAGLSPADIATPIRAMFRDQANARVLLGEVTGIDVAQKHVKLGAKGIAYDTLVLATGAQHSYFGRDEWSAAAPGLKTIEDATAVRRRLLLAFEHAETAEDPEERIAWQTFVIVGGGPTGVELAGAIAELARYGMTGEFRNIQPSASRVVLVQSAPRLLPTFPEPLSHDAARSLQRLGVEVRLEARAEAIDASGVAIAGEKIQARTVLWAAGVEASPAARWLDAPADPAGRVKVGPDLRVPGHEDVFVIGDTCASNAWAGKGVPGLAPAAKQAGAYVASAIRAALKGKPAPRPFAYRHYGSLATIGRKAAVADFGRVRCTGALAWWLWGAAHVLFLVDSRRRAGVVLEWLWDYVTLRRGTRLITGASPSIDG